MKKYFLKSAKISLILVYLVIIAGALVRMTGSGMGCPDWPKCFGYYIPPTDIKELTWSPNREFKKGQVIIKEETLFVATTSFKTGSTFEKRNWTKYTKHDYASFNVYHTWIEYVNRLFGALAGLACLAMAILSFWYWKKDRKITFFSWIVVFMMGFQAWLGKTVVDSVLSPLKITIHMVVALLIVALILYTIYHTVEKQITSNPNTKIKTLILITMLLTIVQVIIGTQVRQHIDDQVKNGVTASILWLQNPTVLFYIHRSFSIIVLGSNVYIFLQNRKLNLGFHKLNWVMLLIGLEIITGMVMFYLDFPFASQPLHLTIASILFGIQFYLLLETRQKLI
jgi:heme a synthase